MEITYGIHPLSTEAIKRSLPAGKGRRHESAWKARHKWEERVTYIHERRCACCYARTHDASTCPYRERED